MLLIADKNTFCQALEEFPVIKNEVTSRAKRRAEKFEANIKRVKDNQKLIANATRSIDDAVETPADSPMKLKNKLLKSNDYFSKMIQALNKQRVETPPSLLKSSFSPSLRLFKSKNKGTEQSNASSPESATMLGKSQGKVSLFATFSSIMKATPTPSSFTSLKGDQNKVGKAEEPSSINPNYQDIIDNAPTSSMQKDSFTSLDYKPREEVKLPRLASLFKNKILPEESNESSMSEKSANEQQGLRQLASSGPEKEPQSISSFQTPAKPFIKLENTENLKIANQSSDSNVNSTPVSSKDVSLDGTPLAKNIRSLKLPLLNTRSVITNPWKNTKIEVIEPEEEPHMIEEALTKAEVLVDLKHKKTQLLEEFSSKVLRYCSTLR